MIRKPARILVSIAAVCLLLMSCMSRYKLELFMTSGSEQKKLKIEKTEYVKGAVISDPYAEEKLQPGSDNCLIVHGTARGRRLTTDRLETLMLEYDEYFRCLLYVELPQGAEVGELELVDRSFIRVLGRYEQAAELKILPAHSGSLAIDSLTGDWLYATLDGDYRNTEGTSIECSGRFRIKVVD